MIDGKEFIHQLVSLAYPRDDVFLQLYSEQQIYVKLTLNFVICNISFSHIITFDLAEDEDEGMFIIVYVDILAVEGQYASTPFDITSELPSNFDDDLMASTHLPTPSPTTFLDILLTIPQLIMKKSEGVMESLGHER